MNTGEYLTYKTRKVVFTKRKNSCYKIMVDLDLNPPIKQAGLVLVRLGKIKTLTTDN